MDTLEHEGCLRTINTLTQQIKMCDAAIKKLEREKQTYKTQMVRWYSKYMDLKVEFGVRK